MIEPFRIAVTRDCLRTDGSPAFVDIDTKVLDDAEGIEWAIMEEHFAEVKPDQLVGFDGLFLFAPKLTPTSLEGADRLTVVARLGVGYDSVDVDACSERGIALTITPDAVRRPVASSVMALMLALAHRIPTKDRLTRQGRWDDRIDHMGVGLTNRVLGVVGLGNIGTEVFRLAAPFDMKFLATDPHASPELAGQLGVTLVDIEELMSTADFVCICCALTDETRGLINSAKFQLMKPTAFFINVARGPIVDQFALVEVLQNCAIAGAGLDVFSEEPVEVHEPILQLDNVIVSPHAIAWTDELMASMGTIAMQSLLDVAAGKPPENVVNRDVLKNHRFLKRLRENRSKNGV